MFDSVAGEILVAVVFAGEVRKHVSTLCDGADAR